MPNPRMLFLDDVAVRHDAIDAVAHIWDIHHTFDSEATIQRLEAGRYDLVSLDHDLEDKHYEAYQRGYAETAPLAKTGWDVVVFMRSIPEERRPKYVNVHSFNPSAKERMIADLRANGYTVFSYNVTELAEVLSNG